jgi:hypothetical protein
MSGSQQNNRGRNLKTIEAQFEAKLNEINVAIENFPWEDTEAYAAWLAQQYYLVRHSSRLLGLALSKIDDAAVRNEYVNHLHGERGHDELLIKDLKTLGRKLEDYPELVSTRVLIHNQYFWLNKATQDSLFGYAQYLEGISVFSVPKVIQRLEAKNCKALAFMKVHADSDEIHYPEGFARIHRNKVDWQTEIIPNLEESHALYMKMFEDIEASLALRKTRKSA